MKTVAFLPVKGTSSRVANKNTRIFNGEPFFVFTLRKLLKCSFIDEVYVDSENEEILEIGSRLGAIPLRRDPELASNKTDGHTLFFNEVRQVDADIYIQHLCTSPFIKESTIKKAVETLKLNQSVDSVVFARAEKQYQWDGSRPIYDSDHIPNSVDLPDTITEAMGLYVVRGDVARSSQKRIGLTPQLLFGEPIELIDVNVESDFDLATIVAHGILAEEEKKLRLLGRFLTSPILSDISDEFGLSTVLDPTYKCNIPGAKIFGRARTLHIREATPNDRPDSIYEALQSYKHVVSNDIIIVKNDLPNLAYFGELNMSLSIRSGAVGAIIGGVTRDTKATSNAGFPVFAKGSYCKDIKGKGAVASINTPIELDGVPIQPSDLVFADQDGIVIIPRIKETAILKRAFEVMTAENNIVADVCQDIDVEGLVQKYGFF